MTSRIEVEGLDELRRSLRRLAPELRKELDRELRGIAKTVAADAKANASWSTRIPGAITTTVTNKGVGVKVRRRRAPHGSIYERGSRGNRGEVRHPLFGNRDRWFSTPTRPFLQPAVDRNRPRIIAEAKKALATVARKIGLGETTNE